MSGNEGAAICSPQVRVERSAGVDPELWLLAQDEQETRLKLNCRSRSRLRVNQRGVHGELPAAVR